MGKKKPIIQPEIAKTDYGLLTIAALHLKCLDWDRKTDFDVRRVYTDELRKIIRMDDGSKVVSDRFIRFLEEPTLEFLDNYISFLQMACDTGHPAEIARISLFHGFDWKKTIQGEWYWKECYQLLQACVNTSTVPLDPDPPFVWGRTFSVYYEPSHFDEQANFVFKQLDVRTEEQIRKGITTRAAKI